MDGLTRHYLNGTEVTEPLGWSDFTEELVRDFERRFIAVKYEGQLTFTHDGYELLNNAFLDSGHCGIVTYEARQMCGDGERTVAKGAVIIADVKFNLTRCEAECSIADDGIGSRIINNMEIPVSPNATVTKNSVEITAVPEVDILLFDPQAAVGTYLAGTRKGWDWYEAMKHAVLYITDTQATFVSDFYENLSTDDRYWISNGYSIRSASITVVRTSWTFKSLFEELAKKYDLWIGIERDSDGNPVLRCEEYSYWSSTSVWGGHPDIQDLIRTCEAARLYAKVDVGCSKAIKETETTLSLPYIPLRGFVNEAFHLSGVCNTDKALDLVNEWVIDSNVIEDVAVNGNDDYDDDLFLIQYQEDLLQAKKGDYLQPGTNPYLYNEPLQNAEVIDRYDLPSAVGAFYDPVDASFRASGQFGNGVFLNANPSTTATFFDIQTAFPNDYTPPNFDPSNAWGNGTPPGTPVSQADSIYTAAATGYYEFECYGTFRVIQQIVSRQGPLAFAHRIALEFVLQRYDSGNNLISEQTALSDYIYQLNAQTSLTHTFGTSLTATDYVMLRNRFIVLSPSWLPGVEDVNLGVFSQGITWRRMPEWYIKTNFVAAGGYVEAGGGGPVVRYEFDRHIDAASWVSLTADPKQRVMISGGPTPDIPTHVVTAKRNVSTGKTEWAVLQVP